MGSDSVTGPALYPKDFTMSTAKETEPRVDEVKAAWLARLLNLVEKVQNWVESDDWVTRRIEVKMSDHEIGKYKAPGLVMQKDATRIMLEPIGRSTIGAEGIVDLYQMPGLDDAAALYYYDGDWQLHYMAPDSPVVETFRQAEHKPLTRESLIAVLDEIMKQDG